MIYSPVLQQGDLPSKPNKSTLIADLEKHLPEEDMNFPRGNLAVILDFKSKMRSFLNLASFGTFDRAIGCVLSAGSSICFITSLHVFWTAI